MQSKWSFDAKFIGNVTGVNFSGIKTVSDCCNKCRVGPALIIVYVCLLQTVLWIIGLVLGLIRLGNIIFAPGMLEETRPYISVS